MLPYILAAVGGYLIGDSLKGKQFAEGGIMDSETDSDSVGMFLRIGDVVKFNKNFKEVFIKETTGIDDATTQYQQLVLNGIDEIGVIIDFDGNISNVQFSDGWKLPMPTKYLILVGDSGKQFAERGTNTFMTTEQIIENFNNAFISISKVETNGKENGMICTIYRDTPKFFPTYYSAWNFYNSKNLL